MNRICLSCLYADPVPGTVPPKFICQKTGLEQIGGHFCEVVPERDCNYCMNWGAENERTGQDPGGPELPEG